MVRFRKIFCLCPFREHLRNWLLMVAVTAVCCFCTLSAAAAFAAGRLLFPVLNEHEPLCLSSCTIGCLAPTLLQYSPKNAFDSEGVCFLAHPGTGGPLGVLTPHEVPKHQTSESFFPSVFWRRHRQTVAVNGRLSLKRPRFRPTRGLEHRNSDGSSPVRYGNQKPIMIL